MKKRHALSAMILIGFCLAIALSACSEAGAGKGTSSTDSSNDDNTLYLINLEQAEHGTISCTRTSARKGTKITIVTFTNPGSGYEVEWVRYNGITITPSAGSYDFLMPAANVTVTAKFEKSTVGIVNSYNIYNNGVLNENILDDKGQNSWNLETTWGDPPSESNLVSDVIRESIPGPNPDVNVNAIKINISKITDYFALSFSLKDMDINFKEVSTLTLWAKAGAKTSPYVRRPGINRVAFGDYTDNQWGKAVWYCGENVPDQKYIALDTSWKQITVPVPKNIDQAINTLTFFFTTEQVVDQVIYLDFINFEQHEELPELVEVTLPETGSVAYGKAAGSPLDSDLELITRKTKFVYKVRGSRYTLYGEDPTDGADAFLTRMSYFYDSSSIEYKASAGNVAGKDYTPTSPGSSFSLTVKYDDVISSSMNITVKGLPQTASDGELVIDDFSNIVHIVDNGKFLVQVPYYWGGTAGDAQANYAGVAAPMHCWVANVLSDSPALLDNGIPLDTWFIAGNLDKNVDLTGTDMISINMGIGKGVTWHLTLSSGYTGVPSTLKPGPKKYELTATFVGTDDAVYTEGKTYDFNRSDFKDPEDGSNAAFDWTNVTAFQFYTDAKINEENKAAIALVTDPFDAKIWEIKAYKKQ